MWGAVGWEKGRELGPVPGAWLGVRGVRSWAGHFVGSRTALAGSPGVGAGESAGNPGSGVFWPGLRWKGGYRSHCSHLGWKSVHCLGAGWRRRYTAGKMLLSYTGLDRVKGYGSQDRLNGID